tara:strand:- start:750 stop:905 length:156 start_codon:yes stop_codon:yes gene_type:complete
MIGSVKKFVIPSESLILKILKFKKACSDIDRLFGALSDRKVIFATVSKLTF